MGEPALPASCPMTAKRPSWVVNLTLGLIVSCEFMLQLDTTIVNVALPRIETDLGMTISGLSWVTNAFLLAFGGMLLLGGRLGDITGHRRVFVVGTFVFTVASLVGGLAPNGPALIAARAGQGIGAALAAPTGLALLALTFRAEAQRNRAFAIYSTISGMGLAVGLVMGGLLTSALSWRWVLLVNVPVGLIVLVLSRRVIDESPRQPARFDVAGAVLSTAASTVIVYSLIRAAETGWTQPVTVAGLLLGLALAVALVRVEARARQPILPLRLFTGRTRSVAYLNLTLVAATLTSVWFFLTQFLQGPLGLDPLRTGLAFLPMATAVFVSSRLVPKLLARFQPRPVAVVGLSLLSAGMFWLSRLDTTSSYPGGVLGPLLISGTGVGLALVSHNLIVVAETEPSETGAATGVLQATLTLGGAIGLAVLVTVFQAAGESADLTAGVAATFTAATIIMVAALLSAVLLLRNPRPCRQEPQQFGGVGDRGSDQLVCAQQPASEDGPARFARAEDRVDDGPGAAGQ